MILQNVKIKGGKENWIGIGQRESGSATQSYIASMHAQFIFKHEALFFLF